MTYFDVMLGGLILVALVVGTIAALERRRAERIPVRTRDTDRKNDPR